MHASDCLGMGGHFPRTIAPAAPRRLRGAQLPSASERLLAPRPQVFVRVLLPDRRLRALDQQPLRALPEDDDKLAQRYLLWWYLEDQVKVWCSAGSTQR